MLGSQVTTETSPNNPLSWCVYGEAVASAGLRIRHAASGPAMLTRGLASPAWDIWLDAQAVDGVATSWSDSDTLAGATTATYAFAACEMFRTSVVGGPVVFPIGTIFRATNGQEFFNWAATYTLGSSGLNSWNGVVGAGPTAFTGDVYRDSNNNTWTIAQDFSGIGFLYGYGATLATISGGGTLTKVSGSGDAALSYVSCNGDDFYLNPALQSVVVGTQANVIENTITQCPANHDPNLTIISSTAGFGGDGTGWTNSDYGQYGEAPP